MEARQKVKTFITFSFDYKKFIKDFLFSINCFVFIKANNTFILTISTALEEINYL